MRTEVSIITILECYSLIDGWSCLKKNIKEL